MMWKSLARFFAILLAAASAAGTARADIFLSAEFALTRGEEDGVYEFTAAVPQAAASSVAPVWPEGCTQTSASHNVAGSRSLYAFTFQCGDAFTADDVIATPWKVDGASFLSNVPGTAGSGTLSGGSDGIAIPLSDGTGAARGLPHIASEFLAQGVWHIWMGWDHLAFVLCLCMLARGRRLVELVTAFTVGHSISLSLAFFELVHIPIPPVEAVIALSIAFMAREALRHRGDMPDGLMRREMTVVALFGLLHGLGFASALEELGVQQAERVPALIFFNLGVEAGQLAFVAGISLLMALLRQAAMAMPVRTATMYGVGIIGSFWMIERTAGFL